MISQNMRRSRSPRYLLTAAILVCATAFAQQPQPRPGGRPTPAPPPELTAEQKSRFQAKIAELDAMVAGFRAKKVHEDLIADVDVYAKAGKWLMEFPQGFP